MSPSSSTHPDPATTGDSGTEGATPAAHALYNGLSMRPRRTTAQSDIHETILHPGNVRINVQGAFIVSDEPTTPRSEDYEHDPRDIRLPNHTSVVSHVAVDASNPLAIAPCGSPLTMCRSEAHSPNSSTSLANQTRPLMAAASTSSSSKQTE